ncbi:hypothetical protein PGT21_032905 [Puccinia graminis f. sp. tritici]|uniref:Histidine kinase/HSP90-like ATPase domain-containing protein n=1 Tax=Puccinia graminis f. sp. tritici TaxID=56615 RepID=A0A5B0QK20_PUCGR|nr:hypothetical protein PGT21_032905 [Puccinia graminis f. sp. tritici]
MKLGRYNKLLTLITLSIAVLNFSYSQEDGLNSSPSDPSDQTLPVAGFQPEQEVFMSKNQEKFEFQSDIARLMKVVVSHLYHDRDVFLRELLSNSGDALEKLRFASLTDPKVLDSAPALNITIVADVPSKRLIIRDSGVGMTKEELQKNLGTIARSGTSEFLSKLDKSNEKTSGTGSNLIGQFGLGFYSSFLVADRVLVSSKSNEDDKQWVFESNADAAEFKISEDPRGNNLGRGTEITLYMKDDALDFLQVDKLKELIATHSEFSTTVPIYVWTEKEIEVPVEEEPKKEGESADESDAEGSDKKKEKDESEDEETKKDKDDNETDDDDDVKVDDDDDSKDDDEDEESKKPKTKTIKKHEWEQVNTKGPIWVRDPKTVTDDEYTTFYKGLTGQQDGPTSWVHFKGDAGRTSFHGLIFVPETLPADFYSKTYAQLDSVKLFVRKVLITKEPSPDFIPKWLNWIKVIVDADDLPLNVGRDSLQVTRSLKQIQNIVLKKFIDHLSSLSKKEPEKYEKLWKKIGTTLKVGVIEDLKNRDKLAKLMKFQSSQSGAATVSLEEYVARRKKNQKQIYFIASAGTEVKDLSRSPFVEKLVARGYEVLYLTEPMDEMITSSLTNFEGMKFQDVAKKGLVMGDEDDDEDEKEALKNYNTQFEPLAKRMKKELEESVSDVVISNRLTTSPCAVVADSYAWTGNMERLMAAQSQQKGADGSNFMMDFIKKAKKTFEINPKHPLIQGLLTKVEEAGEDDASASDELSQVIRVLWDTSLVRSGFTVPDTNSYFDQIELLLRKSLGVDESEKIDVGEIKPAPAVEEGPLDPRASEKTSDDKPAEEDEKIQINSDGSTQKTDESKQDWAEWSKVKDQLKEKAIKDDQKEQKESKKEAAKEVKKEAKKEAEKEAEKEAKKEAEKDDAEEDQLEAEELGEDDDGSADEADDFDFSKLGDMGDFDMEKMKEMMKDFGGFKDEL